MKPGAKAYIAEEGGKLLSDVIRIAMVRPRKPASPESQTPLPTEAPGTSGAPATITSTTPHPSITQHSITEPPATPTTRTQQEELDYRWECCMKHLGGASVLLREAYERAIDEGMGEGTAEKIMEAMSEHSGMEVDLEKMLPIPEAREQVEKLMSGIRAFRNAAWKAKITTGGGTKDDIADARLWNNILYTEAYNSAKSQPGETCIAETQEE